MKRQLVKKGMLALLVSAAAVLCFVLQPLDSVNAGPPTPTPTPTPEKRLHRLNLGALEENLSTLEHDASVSEVESTCISATAQETFYSIADAEVRQGYPTSNYGSSVEMWCGYDDYLNPDGQIVRCLIKFDISSLPAGSTINSATLYVYLSNSWDFPGRTRTYTAYRIPSNWFENTVTWNNAPSYAEAYGSTGVTHGSGNWYPFDVTSLVQAWHNGTYTNYGIMLRGPEYSGADSSWKAFSTKEGSYQPQLVVNYTASSGPIVTSITPNSGQQGSIVHITNLAGNNFQSGATVKIVKTGEADINAASAAVVSASQITCDFDLSGAATGQWDVVVTNPDMQSGTLSKGFIVEVTQAETRYIYFPLVLKNAAPPQDRVAVVVGIAGYQVPPLSVRAGSGEGNLMFTDEDAIDHRNVLINRGGFKPENVKLLVSPYPRGVRADMPYKATIQDAIVNWLDAREDEDTLVVFFFSGHGGYTWDDNSDEADGWDEYIVPYNYPDLDDIILDDELDAWLSELESNRVVVIIDSCFSGGMIEPSSEDKVDGLRKGFGGPDNGLAIAEGDGFARDVNKPGRIVLTASSDTEGSWEFSALQNGVFTYYLVEGLGASIADSNGNGWVSAEEAFSYLVARVDPYVYPRTGEHQNPQLSDGVAGEVDLTQP